MSTKIVVGIDGSAAGAAALRWAARQAEAEHAELHIVHAWQAESAYTAGGYVVPPLALENDIRAHAQRWVEEAVGPLDQSSHPRKLTVVNGTPGPAIVEAAKDADLLVVGTQVHRGLSRVIHGSVSHYCLSHATTPIVAVPAPADDDS